MSYRVFRVADAGSPRDHHAIFVETAKEGLRTGYVFQVVGNIQNGMTHDYKQAPRPEESASFVSKDYLGTVTTANYPRIRAICDSVPAPKKQYRLNTRLYPLEPIRRCQEWTAEAIQALIDAGVLQ